MNADECRRVLRTNAIRRLVDGDGARIEMVAAHHLFTDRATDTPGTTILPAR